MACNNPPDTPNALTDEQVFEWARIIDEADIELGNRLNGIIGSEEAFIDSLLRAEESGRRLGEDERWRLTWMVDHYIDEIDATDAGYGMAREWRKVRES